MRFTWAADGGDDPVKITAAHAFEHVPTRLTQTKKNGPGPAFKNPLVGAFPPITVLFPAAYLECGPTTSAEPQNSPTFFLHVASNQLSPVHATILTGSFGIGTKMGNNCIKKRFPFKQRKR